MRALQDDFTFWFLTKQQIRNYRVTMLQLNVQSCAISQSRGGQNAFMSYLKFPLKILILRGKLHGMTTMLKTVSLPVF